MEKHVSIVDARRELGRLAAEVQRTGRPIVLTRRGRPVARIGPEPSPATASGRLRDQFATLRGTIRLTGSLDALQQTVRQLRSEFAQSLEGRAASPTTGTTGRVRKRD
jgi:prevent-host-death family protein